MCGIAGYVSLNDSPVERGAIERMVTTLKHRGPDAQHVHLDGPVAFGHARLSIIDLAGGDQPLFNEDRSVTVICNGEIYNYRELRERLLRNGHQFRTGSDCEVLAHLWEDDGPDLLNHLRGMFAMVIYDRRKGIVFGARDHFGQKPLYYSENSRGFAFASEVKAILALPGISKQIDPVALDQYLFHQFVPQPRTLFEGIKKLPAGHCFELKLAAHDNTRNASQGSTLSIRRFWHPSFDPDNQTSDEDQLQRVETALIDAVSSHMVADVPVGVFLSGGIDSSLITALAARSVSQPLETFSISFPGSEHDEAPYARSVAAALRTKHREFPFAARDMRQALAEQAKLFDLPLADTAVLPLMSLSRSAAEFIKVVLTGDGGDEIFAGYRKYLRMAKIPGRFGWLSRMSSRLFPIRELAACGPDPFRWRATRARVAMVVAPTCRSEYHRQGWEGWERFALYQPQLASRVGRRFETLGARDAEFDQLAPLNAALQLDQGTVLADRLLFKGDCSTMAFGLEARAPLLDHRLADVAGRLPLHLKVTPNRTKVALREIAARYLPSEIIGRRKKGFSMPLDLWFRNELRDWTRSCLLDESVSLPSCFQRAAIERLLNEHDSGKNHAQRIHTLLMFELWYREYAS